MADTSLNVGGLADKLFVLQAYLMSLPKEFGQKLDKQAFGRTLCKKRALARALLLSDASG
jgi:hypothetical protein